MSSNIAVYAEISRVAGMNREQRPAAIANLLPRIRRFAADTGITSESRINGLTQAARAVDPQLTRERPAGTPQAALQVLLDALDRAGIHRGPGQPAMGPAIKVSLPDVMHAWLTREAERLGFAGQRAQASVIRHKLEQLFLAEVQQVPVEDLAGQWWDSEEAPGLLRDGVPVDALDAMRANHIRAVCANPEAVRQLREWAVGR